MTPGKSKGTQPLPNCSARGGHQRCGRDAERITGIQVHVALQLTFLYAIEFPAGAHVTGWSVNRTAEKKVRAPQGESQGCAAKDEHASVPMLACSRIGGCIGWIKSMASDPRLYPGASL